METKQIISTYETACEHISREFVSKYFTDKDTTLQEVEKYWVADRVGGVICIEDYHFFSNEDMLTALKLNIPKDVLFEWHEKYGLLKTSMNLEHYFLYNK